MANLPLLSPDARSIICQPHGGDPRTVANHLGVDSKALVDFSANINAFGPPAPVLEAFRAAVGEADRYPDLNGAGFIDMLSLQLEIDRGCLLVGNGSAELLYWLIAWLKPARTLIVEPGFVDYRRCAEANGSSVASIYLDAADGFSLDWGLFVNQTRSADVAIVGRPNNPTGTLVEAGRLCAAADSRPDTIFIVDEAFIDFADPSQALTREAASRRNLILLRSLTKIYAIPGIRLGYLIGHEETVRLLNQARPPWPLGAAQIAAGKAALGQTGFAELSRRRLIEGKRSLMFDLQKIPGLQPFPSEANFILIKVLDFAPTSSDLMRDLIKLGIYVRDCVSFNGLSNNYIRVAVRGQADNQKLLQALREVLL